MGWVCKYAWVQVVVSVVSKLESAMHYAGTYLRRLPVYKEGGLVFLGAFLKNCDQIRVIIAPHSLPVYLYEDISLL